MAHDGRTEGDLEGLPPLSPWRVDLLIGLGVGASVAAAAIAVDNSGLEHRYAAAVVALATVAVPTAAGLAAWRRGVSSRFARLLVALGLASFVTTLSNSGSEVLYSVGRVSAWVVQVLVIYAILAFPSGRLSGRLDRAIVASAALVVCVLYLPSALLVAEYPTPSPWSTCVETCPPNAFAVVGSEPGFVDVLERLREILAAGVFLSAAGVLALRARRASPLSGSALMPVLTVAVACFLVETSAVALRALTGSTDATEAASMLTALTLPMISIGFLAGLIRWRLHTAGALERISGGSAAPESGEALERLLADALDDPGLRLYLRAPAGAGPGWRDVSGEAVARPRSTSSRIVMEIPAPHGGVLGLLACDPAVRAQPGLVAAITATVRRGVERERLTEALRASLREVAASRARLATAADVERRRIERDLHDGAQQRLVALRVRLGLVEEALAVDPVRAGRLLAELGPQVDDAIEDVRSLSRGIYPSLLSDAGPAEALRATSIDSPLVVRVLADPDLARHPAEVESAVYFCCLEAIQNAVKHARGATRVDVRIADGDGLRFEIGDDGGGFESANGSAGAGLTNMRDRIAAVGGWVAVDSAPGLGTTVRGSIPAPSERAATRHAAP